MLYFYSIILALVQAVTEFAPISSSAHLIIFHTILRSPVLDSLAFDVMLHAGTFLAVLLYFWPEVKKIIISVLTPSNESVMAQNRRLGWLLVWSSIPAAIVGYFFGGFIESFFRSVHWLVWPLIIGAVFMLLADRWPLKKLSLNDISLGRVFLIGLAQVLAFIPGTSRSGITMTAGLFLGVSREAAAKFSFLMSLPIVFGATIRKIAQMILGDFSYDYLFVFVLGAACAALFGYLVIKYFLRFISRHSLAYFAFYRIILAIVLLVIFF